MAQNNVLIKRDSSWRKIYEVLAAGMKKFISARARKDKRTARMLANVRKDHSIPLAIIRLFTNALYLFHLFYLG